MKSSLLVGTLVAASLVGFAPTAAADPGLTVDLANPSTDTNVTTGEEVRLGSADNEAAEAVRTGYAVYPLRLDAEADTFAASVASEVPAGAELAIDVRGRRADGQWSEWTEILPAEPAVLPEAVDGVEVRTMLSAPEGVGSPSLAELALTPSLTGAEPTFSVQSAGRSYRVYATREGLVGGTTANGHVIKSRDHFVALPSRRGLSNNNAGDYSVRVCASNGRCEWAPVWDVGPWNTQDDYWNPAATRQQWKDLPQGKPEAQAAYENGYNGGKDQFGRTVANPAGIDLADGTFWDGLKLTDNSWVTVTYQWTGNDVVGYVDTATDPVNVRSGTTTSTSIVGMAANYAQVRIECRTTGQSVSGTQGTTSVWYRIASGKYVSAAYVRGGGTAASC